MWADGDHRRVPGDAEPQQPHSRPRHEGARTMLPLLPLLLLLLPAARGTDTVGPAPTLTQDPPLEGVTTASTFVLDQPHCVFENYSNAVIWLVVTKDRGTYTFNNSVRPGNPNATFQNFPDHTSAYMTLNVTLPSYPCPKPSGNITVLRVGSETSCANDTTRPTCNGPLPGPGPYWVKFIALEGSVLVAETNWSVPIMLRTAKPASSISTGSRHSAGMIAITTILSILFAILLAGLVALLVFCGSDSCGSSTFSKQESVTVRRYNTHHVYDQPTARL